MGLVIVSFSILICYNYNYFNNNKSNRSKNNNEVNLEEDNNEDSRPLFYNGSEVDRQAWNRQITDEKQVQESEIIQVLVLCLKKYEPYLMFKKN